MEISSLAGTALDEFRIQVGKRLRNIHIRRNRCAENCGTLRYGWSLPSVIERARLSLGMRPDSLGGQPGIFFRRQRIESLCLRHLQTRATGSEAHLTTRRRLHRSCGFLSRPGFVLGLRSPHNSGSPDASGRRALPLAGTCIGPRGPASSNSFSQGFLPCHSTDSASGTSSALAVSTASRIPAVASAAIPKPILLASVMILLLDFPKECSESKRSVHDRALSRARASRMPTKRPA